MYVPLVKSVNLTVFKCYVNQNTEERRTTTTKSMQRTKSKKLKEIRTTRYCATEHRCKQISKNGWWCARKWKRASKADKEEKRHDVKSK